MDKFEKIEGGGVCAPLGFSAGAVSADIKGKGSGKLDLAMLVSDAECSTSAVFTTNIVKAAPVIYDQKLIRDGARVWGVVVNSGNANACTGQKGYEVVEKTAKLFAEEAELPANSLFIASTGVIGEQMDINKIKFKVSPLVESLDDENSSEFAKAIMTTDTVPKEIAVLVHDKGGSYVIGAACKGAGMIDPNMATFLGFITTDAVIDEKVLDISLKKAVDSSFNCITVDGDMSTNDSLFILANGMSEVRVSSPDSAELFIEALSYVCKQLALMVVKDGEGATKCVTIAVKGAKNAADARACAAKIANSPLVKTMFTGADPNWGRLMSSAGASGILFDPEQVDIYFNDLKYVEKGTMIDRKLEGQVNKIMLKDEYTITIDLNAGMGSSIYYTCDMTTKYVEINADYRS